MKVYITKQVHGEYNYLANWQNPESGCIFGQWFTSLKELKEYCQSWDADYIKVNF